MDIGIDYSLLLYILVCVLIGAGVPYTFIQSQKLYAAIGFLIFALASFIYFGLRWFDGFHLKQSMVGGVDPTSSWPPQINYCPDFLSLKKHTNGNYYCVDAMGVSGLTVFTSTSTIDPTASTANLFGPLTANKKASEYLSDMLSKKLTWEGVYDGISPANVKPPVPS